MAGIQAYWDQLQKLWNPTTSRPEAQQISNGAALVSSYYPDVTTFNSSIVTPVAGVSIPFITAPAGCYAVNIRTANITVGVVITAFSGLCYIERNGDANGTQSYILQAGGEVTMYVDPGDTIEFMGSAGCAGSVLVTPLG